MLNLLILLKLSTCNLLKNHIFEAISEMGNGLKFYTGLMVVYFAILCGMILMISIAFYIKAYGEMIEAGVAWETLQFLVPLFALGCMIGSVLLYQNKTYHIPTESPLSEKLNKYRTAFIIRLALLEAPLLLSAIALILTGQEVFTFISVILIANCLAIYPRKNQIAESLSLNQQEREQFFTTN